MCMWFEVYFPLLEGLLNELRPAWKSLPLHCSYNPAPPPPRLCLKSAIQTLVCYYFFVNCQNFLPQRSVPGESCPDAQTETKRAVQNKLNSFNKVTKLSFQRQCWCVLKVNLNMSFLLTWASFTIKLNTFMVQPKVRPHWKYVMQNLCFTKVYMF